jgi:hypothetical protein
MSGSDAVSAIAILAAIAVTGKFLWGFVKARSARRANTMAPTTGQDTGIRGKITIFKRGRPVITLTSEADASTIIHETGHAWLEELLHDAEHPLAPDQLRADAATVRRWLGAKEGAEITALQHEKFARGFERYMMEGVSPSRTLTPTFVKYKRWMTEIYQNVDCLNVPIGDDIRRVFDRMLSIEPQCSPTKPTTQAPHQTRQ